MTRNKIAALDNLETWCSLSAQEQDEIISDLVAELGKDYLHLFTIGYSNESSFRVPTFKYVPMNLELNLIVGGTFEMGLSAKEEEGARAIDGKTPLLAEKMRPVHQVRVRPFLMSRFPILDSYARDHINLNLDLFRPEFGEEGDVVPIYLTRDEARVLADGSRFNFPSEAQWEYAYRGGTRTLFYFGDSIPDENTLETSILLYNFNDEELCRQAANPFGLVGLNVGEWCEDSYCSDYQAASDSDLPVSGKSSYVVRGGAAPLWPWQGCDEWMLCISAMRRNSETLEDGTAAVRFVKLLTL